MEPVSPPPEHYQLELPYKPSSASVYWKKITIPKGLPALLETFVREAIRENPDDIYIFLATLSESLLAKRAAEEQEAESAAAFKKEKQAADEESPLLDSAIPIPTSYKIEDQKEPVSKEQGENSVSPSSSPPAVVEQDQDALAEETAAATKIQSQFRGFKTRKELREQVQQQVPGSPTPTADEIVPEDEAEQTEKENDNVEGEYTAFPQPEEIAAATKIQSQYRGFKTRKELKEQLNQNEDSTPPNIPEEVILESVIVSPVASPPPVEGESTSPTDPPENEDEDDELIVAATKIQSQFRGFKTRKELKDQLNKNEDSSSPTIPEEVILESVTVAPVGSPPPPSAEAVSTSPTTPLDNEVDDEEIAAEIKTPLETIREESFDLSSSAHHPIPLISAAPGEDATAKSAAENENSVLVEEDEKSSSPDGDVINDNDDQEEDVSDKATLEKEESIDIETSKPNSATSQGRAYQVETVSNEDISAALGAVADSSESGDDPSLREVGETKGPTSSNDIDNKNDEMAHGSSSPSGGEISSSSQDKNDDAKDELLLMADENSAPVQNGDQPSETGLGEEEVQPTEAVASSPQPQPITDNEDGAGIPPREENPESPTDAPVVDGVEDNAEESENVLPPQKDDDVDVDTPPQQDSKEEEALGVINLSSDDGATPVSDTANVSDADQTPICVADDENQGVEEESDKNKKSDVADDDEVGMQNIENAEVETNAEKNTENITDTAPQFTTDGEQPEVGQPVEDVGVGEDAEKTESNQLQQSPSALTTESSVDREDTDIATPTDFSVGEEKESLNLEELKKFASNFEDDSQEFGEQDNKDMDPVSTAEGGVSVEPEIVKTVAPVVVNQPSQESSTSAETASSGDAGVLQVEIKSSEPASPAPAEGDAKPASPEGATAPTEQKSSEETVVANEQAKTPEVASPTPSEEPKPAEEKAAETPISPVATPESATSPAPEAVGTPASEEAKSPEPPVPILRPESGESQPSTEEKVAEQVASPTPSEEKPTEQVTSPTPLEENPAEQVASPTPSEQATSPAPAESPKSPEATPTETPTSPEPVSAESPKSPEPEKAAEVSSPAPPTESPQEPQSPPAASPTAESEIQKTEASPIASPPPTSATPAPEEAVTSPTSEPKSETPTTTQETAIPNNSAPTSPEPSSTTTTTNQPEKSDTETTNQSPPAAAGVVEQPEQASPAPAEIKRGEKAIAIGTVVEEKRKESVEPEKQEKPVVKRRLKQATPDTASVKEDSVKGNSSSTLLAAQAEVASSISTSPPVLRRNKSGSGKNRSRAATNKYRSGLVIEQGISMDEMEKEIEKEMMNSAAIKIQAGFRGFQTRRSLVGVSKKGKGNTDSPIKAAEPSGESAVSEKCLNTNTAAIIADTEASVVGADKKEVVAVVPVAASARFTPDTLAKDAESIALGSHASRGGKPPLSCLRSRSYPGSHEEEHPLLDFDEGEEDLLFHPEPEIDLELDPDYINRAATKIQANFRGYRVRKSFKRPAGKEHNGDKSLLKSQKLAEADKAAEERAKVMETHERLQQRDEDEPCPEDFDAPAEPEKAAAKIQASFRSYKERQKFHRKKKAAITIQASIRGYLTRKRLANMRRRSFQRRRSSAKAYLKELEEIKKVNEAATKIQAVFRGYKVRSKMPRSSMINEQEQFIDE